MGARARTQAPPPEQVLVSGEPPTPTRLLVSLAEIGFPEHVPMAPQVPQLVQLVEI